MTVAAQLQLKDLVIIKKAKVKKEVTPKEKREEIPKVKVVILKEKRVVTLKEKEVIPKENNLSSK
jgi:hypothetical protein